MCVCLQKPANKVEVHTNGYIYTSFSKWLKCIRLIFFYECKKYINYNYCSVNYPQKPVLKNHIPSVHCNPVQGQYRARTGFSLQSEFSQGKPCFHYREPLFSLQGPCIHYRDFPVRITTQGNPCSHYREWVCCV